MFENRLTEFIEYTDVEKEIASHLLEHPEAFANQSISQISDQIFVSKTSIINFAKKIGFSGFSELKYYIKSNLNPGIEDKADKEFKDIINNLYLEVDKTMELLREDIFVSFCDQILESNFIYILSRGVTKNIASMLTYQLRMLDITALFIDEYNLVKTLPSSLDEQDTVLILSLSGETKILVEFANKIMMRKITLLSITSFGNNQIARMSDYHLSIFSESTRLIHRDTNSRVGMMFLTQLIVDYIKEKN